MDELLNKGWDVGVVWQDGRPFGGNTHIRMNLALPHYKVKEAFDRLKKYVF
jgi:cystathionine beta-lyase